MNTYTRESHTSQDSAKTKNENDGMGLHLTFFVARKLFLTISNFLLKMTGGGQSNSPLALFTDSCYLDISFLVIFYITMITCLANLAFHYLFIFYNIYFNLCIAFYTLIWPYNYPYLAKFTLIWHMYFYLVTFRLFIHIYDSCTKYYKWFFSTYRTYLNLP